MTRWVILQKCFHMGNKTLYLLSFSLIITACSCKYEEVTLPASQVIKGVTITPDTIAADGVSKALISVELPFETVDSKRAVALSSNKGLFEIEGKNTTTITAIDTMINGEFKKIAQTSLISDNLEGLATVTINVQNYVLTRTILVSRAYPDIITLSTDKLSYKPDVNAEITLTIQIQRSPGFGKPSPGQEITLTATDKSGLPIGDYRNKTVLTDADGKVVNYFSISPSLNYSGIVTIKASVKKADGTFTPPATVLINVL